MRKTPFDRSVVLTLACVVAGCAVTEGGGGPPVVARSSVLTLDTHPPTAADPVVATVSAGAPFQFLGRYYFVRRPGVGPDMSRFSPANVGAIPVVYSGDTIRVQRGGSSGLVRLIGGDASGNAVFVEAVDNPFVSDLQKVPWNLWGTHAAGMAQCAASIADAWEPCLVEVDADALACQAAVTDELSDCASGVDAHVDEALGQGEPLQFQCLLPAGSSIPALGTPINYDGCDCEFWGTISFQPGDNGCEATYDGSVTNCDSPCEGIEVELSGAIEFQGL